MLPLACGPSQSRLASQEVIRGRKSGKGKAVQPTITPTSIPNYKSRKGRKGNAVQPNITPTSTPNSKSRDKGQLPVQVECITSAINKQCSTGKPQNINKNIVWNLNMTSKPVKIPPNNILRSPTSDDNFLPDLIPPNTSGETSKVVTPMTGNFENHFITPVISLVSPPTINRTLSPPINLQSESNEAISNLNDLQSTLEISIEPGNGSELGEPHNPVSQVLDSTISDRKVVTEAAYNATVEDSMGTFTDLLPNQCSTPKQKELYPNACTVVTNTANNADQMIITDMDSPMSPIAKTPTHLDETSQTFSSPRSVITESDQQELDTANILIQMSNSPTDKAETTSNYVIDQEHELPVGSERLEDVVEQMDKSRKDQIERTDSDATVEYPNHTPEKNNIQTSTENSPKGHINYKHYGIKRQSPKVSKSRNYQCYFCEAVCNSKQQLNRHHKSEHARVKCPTCKKQFPTPDALQRHRYGHREDHQLTCDICQETCAFKSDLVNHMEKHKEDRPWVCTENGCGKDFKRKSDLTAHEVIHRGEYFICEFRGCTYKNVDPRLVKRHQRVHTKEAKVKCKKCNRLFVFYQQMKRHLLSDH